MSMRTLNRYIDNVEKSSYVLGSDLWESKFHGLLSLVKEYIIDVWEIRKHQYYNYDSDSGPGQQLHSRSAFRFKCKQLRP